MEVDYALMKQIMEQYFFLLNGKRPLTGHVLPAEDARKNIGSASKRFSRGYIKWLYSERVTTDNLACEIVNPTVDLRFPLAGSVITPQAGSSEYDELTDTLWIYDGQNWQPH